MKLETKRLFLYPISDEDIKQMIENEPKTEIKQAYSEMLQGCIENPENRIWYSIWIMELKEKTGIIVGDFCFKGPSKNGIVEIGYGLRDGFCGNGFMTEAVKAISEWAFTQENVNIIEAETSDDNEKSKNVLLKTGFKFSGKFGEEGPRFQLIKNL
ncbi:MAG: GNAT family N-acetyltransferase [Bacteroidales bacterium]|nr:GNAT family N-acetyltransferase [Bacteroidales bacterium]